MNFCGGHRGVIENPPGTFKARTGGFASASTGRSFGASDLPLVLGLRSRISLRAILTHEKPSMMLGFVIQMIVTAVTLAILATAFTGIGLALRRAFGLRTLRLDSCFLAFWVGYSVVLMLLILWNFAFPVGLAALVLVLAAGGLGIAWTSGALARMFDRESWRPNLWEIAFLTLAGLWVVNHCLAAFESWDGVLYHVQAVQWAKAYHVVPGLANLHGPLAFNNSSFLYDAMLDSGWWEGRAFHVANGLLLLVAVLQAIVSGLQWLHGGQFLTSHRLFGFLMLPVALHVVGFVASYSTDLPMTLVLMAAAWLLYSVLDTDIEEPLEREVAYRIFALAMLIAAAVSIKVSAGVFAAVALPVGIIAWWRRNQPRGTATSTRTLLWTTFALAVFAGAWTARSVVLSGYPIFPVSIAGAPVEWRAPAEQAAAESAYIAYTERAFTWRPIGSNWVRLIFMRDVYAVLVPSCLAAAGLWVRWRWGGRRRDDTERRRTWWLLLPVLVAIAVWFVTAPSHRYAPIYFWTLAAVCMCEGQRALDSQLTAHGRRWVSGLLVAVAMSPLFVKPSLEALTESRGLLQTILEHNLVGPAPDVWLSTMGGRVDVTTFTTRSGAVVNVPVKRASAAGPLPNACWAAPIPCTPNPAPNLTLRDPARLDKGFRVDGAWEMLDWPYYWHSYYLPEWRNRHRPH